MKSDAEPIDRATAVEYASWFRALSDATRVQIVSLLARQAEQRGTATYYRINEACVECFPTAADIVMGRPVPAQPISA